MRCHDYAIFSGPTSKNIPLEALSPHANFESSRSNSNKSTKFDPKFDLSDIVHSLAISNKPTEQMGGVINVSYPKFRALSIDSSFEHIKTIHLMMQWYLYRSSVFTQKWLVKSEMALLLKMFCWGQSICLPTFMLVAQSERFQLILTLATGLVIALVSKKIVNYNIGKNMKVHLGKFHLGALHGPKGCSLLSSMVPIFLLTLL